MTHNDVWLAYFIRDGCPTYAIKSIPIDCNRNAYLQELSL